MIGKQFQKISGLTDKSYAKWCKQNKKNPKAIETKKEYYTLFFEGKLKGEEK